MIIVKRLLLAPLLSAWLLATTPSGAATFSERSSEPFGTFNNIEFVRHTGRFEGTTSMGDFSVPFEVIAQANPEDDTGTVLFEPPQWAFAPFGRDLILGRGLIFGRGISYASVGFGVDAGNILDPTLDGLMIAGAAVPAPGVLKFGGPTDREILIQFIEAMRADPQQIGLHAIEYIYAYGVSRSADILMSVHRAITGTANAGLFDLTLLHNPIWKGEIPLPAPPPGGFFDDPGEEFVPPPDIGRVMFVMAEGDQIISAAEAFRRVADLPDQRIYEVSGAAHTPTAPVLAGFDVGDNPINHYAVMRGLFVSGDEWVRFEMEPPPNAPLESAPAGEIDPIYGFETGIARDTDGNALGGVRMPDLAIGQGLFIASDPATSNIGIPFLNPLTGSHIDLECLPVANDTARIRKPRPGRQFGRFRNHGEYVSRFARQANRLVGQGFLLPADAEVMKTRAAESGIGKPGHCAP